MPFQITNHSILYSRKRNTRRKIYEGVLSITLGFDTPITGEAVNVVLDDLSTWLEKQEYNKHITWESMTWTLQSTGYRQINSLIIKLTVRVPKPKNTPTQEDILWALGGWTTFFESIKNRLVHLSTHIENKIREVQENTRRRDVVLRLLDVFSRSYLDNIKSATGIRRKIEFLTKEVHELIPELFDEIINDVHDTNPQISPNDFELFKEVTQEMKEWILSQFYKNIIVHAECYVPYLWNEKKYREALKTITDRKQEVPISV